MKDNYQKEASPHTHNNTTQHNNTTTTTTHTHTHTHTETTIKTTHEGGGGGGGGRAKSRLKLHVRLFLFVVQDGREDDVPDEGEQRAGDEVQLGRDERQHHEARRYPERPVGHTDLGQDL